MNFAADGFTHPGLSWQRRCMTDAAPQNPEQAADRRADRRTILFIGLTIALSFFLEATSLQLEAATAGRKINAAEPWVREGASHLMTLLLLFLVPRALNRAPLSEATWRWAAPMHMGFFAVFCVVHVLGFVMIRKALYPPLFGVTYDFGLRDPLVWIYEARKDAFSYASFILVALFSRAFEQRSLELAVARDMARSDQRLTLKSGGRTIYLNADDIIWAKAAANYVEIGAAGKTHLARMTLAGIERLLADAGSNHTRIHRSHLVKKDAIREIAPAGNGDQVVKLTTGEAFPVSRRYRHALSA